MGKFEGILKSRGQLDPSSAQEPKSKASRRTGKRSDPEFVQLNSWIRRETYRRVKLALLMEGKDREISQLVEDLLSSWLSKKMARLKEMHNEEDKKPDGVYAPPSELGRILPGASEEPEGMTLKESDKGFILRIVKRAIGTEEFAILRSIEAHWATAKPEKQSADDGYPESLEFVLLGAPVTVTPAEDSHEEPVSITGTNISVTVPGLLHTAEGVAIFWLQNSEERPIVVRPDDVLSDSQVLAERNTQRGWAKDGYLDRPYSADSKGKTSPPAADHHQIRLAAFACLLFRRLPCSLMTASMVWPSAPSGE